MCSQGYRRDSTFYVRINRTGRSYRRERWPVHTNICSSFKWYIFCSFINLPTVRHAWLCFICPLYGMPDYVLSAFPMYPRFCYVEYVYTASSCNCFKTRGFYCTYPVYKNRFQHESAIFVYDCLNVSYIITLGVYHPISNALALGSTFLCHVPIWLTVPLPPPVYV